MLLHHSDDKGVDCRHWSLLNTKNLTRLNCQLDPNSRSINVQLLYLCLIYDGAAARACYKFPGFVPITAENWPSSSIVTAVSFSYNRVLLRFLLPQFRAMWIMGWTEHAVISETFTMAKLLLSNLWSSTSWSKALYLAFMLGVLQTSRCSICLFLVSVFCQTEYCIQYWKDDRSILFAI